MNIDDELFIWILGFACEEFPQTPDDQHWRGKDRDKYYKDPDQ